MRCCSCVIVPPTLWPPQCSPKRWAVWASVTQPLMQQYSNAEERHARTHSPLWRACWQLPIAPVQSKDTAHQPHLLGTALQVQPLRCELGNQCILNSPRRAVSPGSSHRWVCTGVAASTPRCTGRSAILAFEGCAAAATVRSTAVVVHSLSSRLCCLAVHCAALRRQSVESAAEPTGSFAKHIPT